MSNKSGNTVSNSMKILGSLAGIAISVAAVVLDNREENLSIKSNERTISHKDSKVLNKIDYIKHCDELYTMVKGRVSYRFTINQDVLYDYLLESLKDQDTKKLEFMLQTHNVSSYDMRSILREVNYYIRYELNR